MKSIIILIACVGGLGVLGVILYGRLWFYYLKKAADACAKRPGENLCVRTDGLFPTVGPRPPEKSMWRVKTGMYSLDGSLIFTYRYKPEMLHAADLDERENVEAGIRAMEAHGRAVLEEQARAS